MFRPDRGILDKKSNIPIQKLLCMHTQVLEIHSNLIESDVIPNSSLDLLECTVSWIDVHCLNLSWFEVLLWFSLKMYPTWQVSQVKVKSNGSSYNALLHAHPGDWWMDMDIHLQESCERALSSSKRCIQICFQDMNYIYDLESMTQLNLKSGALRQIRRRVLFVLP